ncbi:MAG: SPOR domain-containing protein [bacterium]|nr:SPOR domain-containing protein [bacterium]
MDYNFSLNNRHISAVTVGLCAVGVLIFVAGVLVGVYLQLPELEARTAVMPEAEVPVEPEVARTTKQFAVPDYGPDDETLELEIEASASTGVSGLTASYPVERNPFTVQVGAFWKPRNAERLYEALWKKGYAPHIFSAWDTKNRLWHCVRIGYYKDRTSARREMNRFMAKQKKEAIIRPSDTL